MRRCSVPTSAVSSFDYWARETRVPQTATTTSVFWPLSDRRKFPQRHADAHNSTKETQKSKRSLPNIGAHLTDLLVLVHHRVVDGRHIALSPPLRLLSEKQICVEFFTLSLSLSPRGGEGFEKNKKRPRDAFVYRFRNGRRRRRRRRKKKRKTTTTKARNLSTTTSSTHARARKQTNKQTNKSLSNL